MENTIGSKEFNHEAGLKVIYEMIESVKTNIGRNYFYYLFWGYLVVATCIIEYLLIAVVNYAYHFIVWPILMPLGSIITFFFFISQKRQHMSKTYIGTFMGYLWGGWVVSLIILIVFAYLKHDYTSILPVSLAMYGMGIFISGGVVNFKPLILGGILAWLSAIASYFMPYMVQLPFMAAVVVISYIIPGHILKAQSKKAESHV